MIKSFFYCLVAFIFIATELPVLAQRNTFVEAIPDQDSVSIGKIDQPEDNTSISQSWDYSVILKPGNAQCIVTTADFNAGFIHDPIGLIEGRVAGLSIIKPGGDPNEHY